MLLAEIDFCSPKDLDALEAIERSCFVAPWPRGLLAADMGERGGSLYLGARWKGRLVAFAACRIERKRLHIVRLAVLEDFRRHGFGSQLLVAMEEVATIAGCVSMFLEVRDGNLTAQAFYARWGFSVTGRSLEYYRESGEDALLMEGLLPLTIR